MKKSEDLSDSQENLEINPTDKRGMVPFLYYKWKGENGEKANFTLIYSHGNAEDIGQSIFWMKKLRNQLQVDVVTYDYIGYGVSKRKTK